MHRAVITGLISLFLVAACGRSAPTTYYALEDTTAFVQQDRLPAKTLRIARVALPQYLEREPIVTRTNGVVELGVNPVHVWAEPLGDGIRRVLQTELSAPLLTHGLTVLPLASESSGTYTLLVDILRLDGELGKNVALAAQWSLLESAGNRTVDDGIFTAESALGSSSYAELVHEESILVRRLAAHLVQRITEKRR